MAGKEVATGATQWVSFQVILKEIESRTAECFSLTFAEYADAYSEVDTVMGQI